MATKPTFSWIHPDLRHLAVSVEKLTPHGRNARRHPKRNIDELAESLRDHGQVRAAIATSKPMVLYGKGNKQSPRGTVLVGNGMLAAARQLGWTHLAVLEFKGTKLEARKLALRDNRTGELSEWDRDALAAELLELGEAGLDLASLGWDEHEADLALASLESIDPLEEWNGAGMPDFSQPNAFGVRRIVVHLKTAADVLEFERRIGQKLTEKTRSIWFPEQKPIDYGDSRHVSDAVDPTAARAKP